MVKENQSLLFRLLNIWFAFIALLFFSSYLPRWQNTSYHLWVNEACYFLLFLLAVSIFIKDNHNKDIFINLSIYLLAHSFSFLNIFTGKEYLVGDDYFQYYFFHYKKLILCFLLNFFIIYVVFKYLFSTQKTRVLYLLTFGTLLPVFLFHFYPYLTNIEFIFTLGDQYTGDLFRRILLTQFLSFFFVFLYGYLVFKKDKILGEYINILVACFFVVLVTEMVNDFSRVYQFQIYSISQYIITTNLIFLCVILFKKLVFLRSDYGQFYESLIQNEADMGKIRVERRHNRSNVILIRVLKIYLYQRRNYLMMLVLLVTLGLIYFQFTKFFAINVVAFMCCFLSLFWFINVLYKKRAKERYTLP